MQVNPSFTKRNLIDPKMVLIVMALYYKAPLGEDLL
jgi:hypothetical protein